MVRCNLPAGSNRGAPLPSGGPGGSGVRGHHILLYSKKPIPVVVHFKQTPYLYLATDETDCPGGLFFISLPLGYLYVGEWFENGVHKALIASLTNLSTSRPWMISPYNTTLVGPTAQSYSNGSTNTDAIIAKTGVPATTAYAAGLTKLYLGGGFTDWYLPAVWELNMCFNSAAIVNKVLGNVNGFFANNAYYWSSTEFNFSSAFRMYFINGTLNSTTKTAGSYVRAVRIHTL
jgi:hypothetical protein